MDVKDGTGFYHADPRFKLFKTYEGEYEGRRVIIYRRLYTGMGEPRLKATIASLKKREPNVGFWPGDYIEEVNDGL